MNFYFFLIIIISVLILIGSVKHGFRKGFVHEVTAVISLTAGLLVISLLSSVIDQFHHQDMTGVIIGIILLAVFGIAYRIAHVFLTSINFLARLPIVRWLDSALGVVSGFLIGFGILYLIEFLLRNYILR